jgi:hypothetical protein
VRGIERTAESGIDQSHPGPGKRRKHEEENTRRGLGFREMSRGHVSGGFPRIRTQGQMRSHGKHESQNFDAHSGRNECCAGAIGWQQHQSSDDQQPACE